jgi:hypothetical protein
LYFESARVLALNQRGTPTIQALLMARPATQLRCGDSGIASYRGLRACTFAPHLLFDLSHPLAQRVAHLHLLAECLHTLVFSSQSQRLHPVVELELESNEDRAVGASQSLLCHL